MASTSGTRWPIWLFICTALGGLFSTAATLYYYHNTTSLQDQEHSLTEKQVQYQTEVEELKKRVAVTRTITQLIPTPVVTMKRNCVSIFGRDVCTDVPESRIEQREIQTTVSDQDPLVKQQLDAKLKELEELSAKAVTTQRKQVDLKDLVETLRRLVSPVISVLVTIAALFIILSKKYAAESEKWAFGSLGTILGFWLK